VLTHLPIAAGCVYFSTYANAILGASNFVTGIDPVSCSGSNCTAVFLPGGIQLTRRLDVLNGTSLNLNATVLDGAPAVLINDAPGYQVEFFPIEADFSFQPSTDCATFGETRGQGLRLCVASNNSTIVAGTASKVYMALIS
jgi:hypothetical protein